MNEIVDLARRVPLRSTNASARPSSHLSAGFDATAAAQLMQVQAQALCMMAMQQPLGAAGLNLQILQPKEKPLQRLLAKASEQQPALERPGSTRLAIEDKEMEDRQGPASGVRQETGRSEPAGVSIKENATENLQADPSGSFSEGQEVDGTASGQKTIADDSKQAAAQEVPWQEANPMSLMASLKKIGEGIRFSCVPQN